MGMNSRGITALVDAMAFMVIMMLVVTATVGHFQERMPEGPDAGEVMGSLCGVRVRLSDMDDGGEDDRLEYLTNILAACTSGGDGERGYTENTADYIQQVLDTYCSGHPYRMRAEYEGNVLEFGRGPEDGYSVYSDEVPVSFGGVLRLRLSIGS